MSDFFCTFFVAVFIYIYKLYIYISDYRNPFAIYASIWYFAIYRYIWFHFKTNRMQQQHKKHYQIQVEDEMCRENLFHVVTT